MRRKPPARQGEREIPSQWRSGVGEPCHFSPQQTHLIRKPKRVWETKFRAACARLLQKSFKLSHNLNFLLESEWRRIGASLFVSTEASRIAAINNAKRKLRFDIMFILSTWQVGFEMKWREDEVLEGFLLNRPSKNTKNFEFFYFYKGLEDRW